MKRVLFIAGALAALCITSCKKNEVIIPETKTDLSISATPYLQMQNASTKSLRTSASSPNLSIEAMFPDLAV